MSVIKLHSVIKLSAIKGHSNGNGGRPNGKFTSLTAGAHQKTTPRRGGVPDAAWAYIQRERAEAWCLHEGTIYARGQGAKVWVFGNDNQGVGRGYIHGFSRCHGVHSLIKLSAIDPKQVVVMADVPTSVNVSDIGTRPANDYTPIEVEFRRKETWASLKSAYTTWKHDASAYHVAPLNSRA